MAELKDVADEQVKGLARYLPTTLSKNLAALLIPGSLGAFTLLRGNMSWFGLGQRPEAEQTLIAAVSGLAIMSAILLLLACEFASVVSSSKHRRISHFSTEYPLLSPRWFAANADPIHWLTLGLVSTILFCAGFYAGRI